LTTKTKQQLCFCYISLLETWSVIVNLIYIRYLYASYKNEQHFQQYFSYIVVVSFIGGVHEENHRPAASHWQTFIT